MEKYAQKNIKAISSFMHFCCRTPPGVRGLKLPTPCHSTAINDLSHPTRGAWIEIVSLSRIGINILVAPHPGCVD